MATVIIPESLFVVFERDTFERITYDGHHWKLNFPLAYELYEKNPEKRCIYEFADVDGRQALMEMTKTEIEEYAKLLKSKIKSYLGVALF